MVALAANGFMVGKRQQKRKERCDHCEKCAGNNRDKAAFDGMSHVKLQLPLAPDLLRRVFFRLEIPRQRKGIVSRKC